MKFLRTGVLCWIAALWLCAVFYAVLTVGRAAGSLEAELLYEASRLRRGLPLYVDPVVGVLDDGPLGIRKVALYTPFWSLFLSLLPSGLALRGGRLLSALVWFSGVPFIVWRAACARAKGAGRGRASVLLPLGFFGAVAGAFLLVRAGIGCNVEPIATALAAAAFARVVSRGRARAVDGVLFASAALLQPHVLGMALGTFLRGRRADRAGLLAFLGASLFGALALFVGSHGAWPGHMLSAAAMPLDVVRFLDAMLEQGAVLGLPHLVAAWAVARYAEGPRGRGPALSGVLASTFLALFLMAQHGGATSYWLEPTAAASVALVSIPPRSRLWRVWSLLGLSAFAAVVLAMNVRALPKEGAGLADLDYSLRHARTLCTPRSGESWGAGNPDLEWFLTGKVTRVPAQLEVLVRARRLPIEALESEYENGSIGCFAIHGRALNVELAPEAPPPADALFGYLLFRAMQDTFEPVGSAGDIHVFRRRRLGP